MLSTGEDRSLFLRVLVLLDFAARKALVEYLQRRVARVTPHPRPRPPMMTPMAAETTSEKKDDSKNGNHAEHHQWEHPPKMPAITIAPHMMPRPRPIIPLGRSGWLRRLLSERQ